MERLSSKLGWEIVDDSWPDFSGNIFRDRPRSIAEVLERSAAAHGPEVGVIAGDQRLTFADVDASASRIAARLQERGVGKGDRVALLLGIGAEFVLCFFAIQKLGAIAVPLNTRFKGEELAYELDDSESRVLVVDEEYWGHIDTVRTRLKTVEAIYFHGSFTPAGVESFADLLEGAATSLRHAHVDEHDDALILYTSGTTGHPKGALLHHRGLIATAMHVTDFLTLGPGDKFVGCVPLFHVTGLAMVLLAAVYAGVPCVYVRAFKAKEFLDVCAREGVTKYMGVINILWLTINHPDFDQYDLSALDGCMLGGSPATEEMVNGLRAKLPNLVCWLLGIIPSSGGQWTW